MKKPFTPYTVRERCIKNAEIDRSTQRQSSSTVKLSPSSCVCGSIVPGSGLWNETGYAHTGRVPACEASVRVPNCKVRAG